MTLKKRTPPNLSKIICALQKFEKEQLRRNKIQDQLNNANSVDLCEHDERIQILEDADYVQKTIDEAVAARLDELDSIVKLLIIAFLSETALVAIYFGGKIAGWW